jgi:hypothetical protein
VPLRAALLVWLPAPLLVRARVGVTVVLVSVLVAAGRWIRRGSPCRTSLTALVSR